METTQSVEDGIPTQSVGTSQSIAIIKTYDLIRWSSNHTSKFPRHRRFVH